MNTDRRPDSLVKVMRRIVADEDYYVDIIRVPFTSRNHDEIDGEEIVIIFQSVHYVKQCVYACVFRGRYKT